MVSKFGRVNVVITGGTKGLGKAIADILLSENNNIVFCARNKEDVKRREQEWRLAFPKAEVIGIQCDMSNKGEVIAFANEILSKWKKVDVLVNNAGMFIPGEIVKEEDGALEQMINVNLYSAYHLTRLIVPTMIQQGSGHIFNMCSVASLIAYPNGGSYSISKFALLGFTKVLREELKTAGVKVTAILPGAAWSASWEGVDLPRERLMEANDVAICVSSALKMSDSAVVEDIVLRPQLGDL